MLAHGSLQIVSSALMALAQLARDPDTAAEIMAHSSLSSLLKLVVKNPSADGIAAACKLGVHLASSKAAVDRMHDSGFLAALVRVSAAEWRRVAARVLSVSSGVVV